MIRRQLSRTRIEVKCHQYPVTSNQGRSHRGTQDIVSFWDGLKSSVLLITVQWISYKRTQHDALLLSFIPRSLFCFLWFLIYSVTHYRITFAFVICVNKEISSSKSRGRDLIHASIFLQSTCFSALEQSATKSSRCYMSHIVQKTCRQLYKLWTLKALPIKLINVKPKLKLRLLRFIITHVPHKRPQAWEREGTTVPSEHVVMHFCALVVTAKRSVDELLLHYFHNLPSASGDFAPRPPPRLHP